MASETADAIMAKIMVLILTVLCGFLATELVRARRDLTKCQTNYKTLQHLQTETVKACGDAWLKEP